MEKTGYVYNLLQYLHTNYATPYSIYTKGRNTQSFQREGIYTTIHYFLITSIS